MALDSSDRERLVHMLEAINRIGQVIEGITYTDFQADWQKRLLVERLLEIAGEAANHPSEGLTSGYPDIPWTKITVIRNVISHEYFRLDEEILWNTVTQSIPLLKDQIEQILARK